MNEETLKLIAGQLRRPHGEQAVDVGEKMNESNRLINLHAIGALRLGVGNHILEIGMGNGAFVKNILAFDGSIKYTGCDFSEEMIDEAQKRNEVFIKNNRAQFCLSCADKLPFGPETFDNVFSVNTIYFWEDQQRVLSEVHRVLKPKGQLLIAIRPKSVMQHYPFVKFGFNVFAKDDVVGLLSANNFSVQEIREKIEPEQDINGEKFKVESLLVSAEKRK